MRLLLLRVLASLGGMIALREIFIGGLLWAAGGVRAAVTTSSSLRPGTGKMEEMVTTS